MTRGRDPGYSWVVTSTTTPLITTDGDTVSTLDSFDSVRIPTASLRPGMILVDDLGCAAAALDHRIGARPGGTVAWLVEDLSTGRYVEAIFPSTKAPAIRVASR